MPEEMPKSTFGEDGTASVEESRERKDVNTSELRGLEAKAGDGDTVKIATEEENRIHQQIDSSADEEGRVQHKGHLGSVFFICTIFLLMISSVIMLSPSLLLVNDKEHLVNDLDDGLGAYSKYAQTILGGQIGGGCSEKTIQCKFKTMSPALKKSFEAQGFKVVGTKNKDTDRYSVGTVTYPDGSPVLPGALGSMSGGSYEQKRLMNRVYSLKNSIFQSRGYQAWLYQKFGIEQALVMSGDTKKDVAASFDAVINPSTDSLDANGQGTYSLKYLADNTDKWSNEIYPNLMKKAYTHQAIACSLRAYGDLARNNLANAKATTIARFAAAYLTAADGIKAGLGVTPKLAEVLASNISATYSDKKNGLDGSSYRAPAMGEQPTTLLPGDYMNALTLQAKVALGIDIPGVAPQFAGAQYLRDALNVPQTNASDRSPAGLCASGMSAQQMGFERSGACYSPASMPLASYMGPSAAAIIGPMKDPIERVLCPFAYPSVVELVKNAILTAMSSLSIALRLKPAATLESQKFTIDTVGTDAQDALFSGTGLILGGYAQALGMRPASIATLTMYLSQTGEQRRQLDEQRREIARSDPWNVYNPYSLSGSIVGGVFGLDNPQGLKSTFGVLSTVAQSLPRAVSNLTSPAVSAAYNQPLHFNPARLIFPQQCGLEGVLDINPDFGCNLRYSMSPIELNPNIDQILSYMTQAHPDNAPNDVDAKDTGADPINGGRMKSDASTGKSAPYIDKVTGRPNDHTEYAKFLQFCANRTAPWGSMDLVVESKPENYEADERDVKTHERFYGGTYPGNASTHPDGNNNSSSSSTNNTTLQVPESYYALGWGGKADQDWYTGKKCLEDSQMLQNFRQYTMACAVLASMSGAEKCWFDDSTPSGADDFYITNDVLFTSPA